MARRRFDVRLSDVLNGFLAHGKVETWAAEAEAWLRDQARAHFPDSKFAQDELREAQAHWSSVKNSVSGQFEPGG
jgi:hypothetical protein